MLLASIAILVSTHNTDFYEEISDILSFHQIHVSKAFTMGGGGGSFLSVFVFCFVLILV